MWLLRSLSSVCGVLVAVERRTCCRLEGGQLLETEGSSVRQLGFDAIFNLGRALSRSESKQDIALSIAHARTGAP